MKKLNSISEKYIAVVRPLQKFHLFSRFCFFRDAPDTDRVRGPAHLQGVPLPVRQLLLVHHLYRLLQGKVCTILFCFVL